MLKLADQLADYAKDIRLNIASVMTQEGSPGLELKQIWGIALASAYATKDPKFFKAVEAETLNVLVTSDIDGAKKAAVIMGMSNVYYRFTHYVSDESVTSLPARLRMNVIANPGVAKIDFELYCLAVSAINGCGKCMNAHALAVKKLDVRPEAIQATARIAAVVHACYQALQIASE